MTDRKDFVSMKANFIALGGGAAVLLLLSMAPGKAADVQDERLRLAMMDMMPMGGGGSAQQPAGSMPGMLGAQPASPAPGGGMGNDMMRMGGAAQPQSPMPMPMPMGQPQQRMSGCPMMAPMMQGGAMPQGMQGDAGMAGAQPMGSSAARLEGRIAFLRTELRITNTQAPAWESFAAALRTGREHLDAARLALQGSATGTDPMDRLASFESHLRERTEAIHITRMAFSTLYVQLDDVQKRTATTIMLPFIGSF